MRIRDHLTALAQSGYYAEIFEEGSEEKISEADRLMRTEISIVFPLLSDEGKSVLRQAWAAHRTGETSAAARVTLSAEQSEGAAARATLVEAVEDLVENERFTDPQVEFIACEMLGMDGPEEEERLIAGA